MLRLTISILFKWRKSYDRPTARNLIGIFSGSRKCIPNRGIRVYTWRKERAIGRNVYGPGKGRYIKNLIFPLFSTAFFLSQGNTLVVCALQIFRPLHARCATICISLSTTSSSPLCCALHTHTHTHDFFQCNARARAQTMQFRDTYFTISPSLSRRRSQISRERFV